MALKEKVPKFKIPRSLAAAADLYYLTREKRLLMEKQAAAIKDQETQLAEYLIEKMPVDGEQTGVRGKVCSAHITSTPIPVVSDWKKFEPWLIKNKMLHLLQRRIATAAVEEVLAAKKKIPGIGTFNVKKVSIHKL